MKSLTSLLGIRKSPWGLWRAAAISGGFGIVGYWFTWTVAQTIITQDASIEARRWSTFLDASQTDLRAMLQGLRPSSQMQETLNEARNFGSVVEISFHGLDGKQSFHQRIHGTELKAVKENAVESLDNREAEEEINLYERFPVLMAIPASSRDTAIIDVREADDAGEVGFESEVVLPLHVAGKVIGYALIELDLTERWNALVTAIRPFSLLCAVLFAILPVGFAFVLRRRTNSINSLAMALGTDPLTKIGSRQALYDLETILNQSEQGVPIGTAIFYLDVDKFKYFNDNFGHEFGDEVLKAIGTHASELKTKYPNLQAFRLGGDEFVIVVQDVGSDAAALEIANDLQQISSFANSPNGSRPTCSIGIFRQNDAEGGPRLFDHALARADAALYASKNKGGNTNTLFDSAMELEWQSQKTTNRLLLESEITRPFLLHYQPYYDLQSKTLKGFEALIRMRTPDGKLVPPDKFVPLAERNGSIEYIGARCLIAACVEASNWPPEIMISVNISPLQFRSGNLLVHIKTALELARISASQLEIEITESILIENFSSVTAQLEAIKELGVSVALDDFGTGYSSLSYLWRFPFSKIKIDKSFVQKIEQDDGAFKILAIIIELAQRLGLETTAEGIETEKQRLTLKELECTLGQGFLFSKPVEDIQARLIILRAQLAEARANASDPTMETGNCFSIQYADTPSHYEAM
jgi:diguanylate cyclase (GGDEF)-like protein